MNSPQTSFDVGWAREIQLASCQFIFAALLEDQKLLSRKNSKTRAYRNNFPSKSWKIVWHKPEPLGVSGDESSASVKLEGFSSTSSQKSLGISKQWELASSTKNRRARFDYCWPWATKSEWWAGGRNVDLTSDVILFLFFPLLAEAAQFNGRWAQTKRVLQNQCR